MTGRHMKKIIDKQDDRSYFLITMKNKDDKREKLLNAGSALMLSNGYHGTGIQEIVDAAGVPKGSFYNYFKSKEDFVLAAMENTGRPDSAVFESALKNSAMPPAERIYSLFKEKADSFVREKSYTKGCFVGNMCQEMADSNESVAEKAEYLFRGYTTALANCIREIQGVDPTRDADKLAEFIFNSWEGAILRMKSSRNAQPLNAFLEALKILLDFQS